MSFWHEQYIPPPENSGSPSPSPSPSDSDSGNLSSISPFSNETLSGLVPLPDGRYRAFRTLNKKRHYIGTFPDKDSAITAQIEFTLTGHKPLQRKHTKLSLRQLVVEFVKEYGEW